jgi:hypothetical protein
MPLGANMDDKYFYFINGTIAQLIGVAGIGLGYLTLHYSHLAPKKDAKIKLALKLSEIGAGIKALLQIFEVRTSSGEEVFHFNLDEDLPTEWTFTQDEKVMLVNLGEHDKEKKVNYLIIEFRLKHFLNNREFQPPPISPGEYPFGRLLVRKKSYVNFKGELGAAVELIETAARKLSGNKTSIL